MCPAIIRIFFVDGVFIVTGDAARCGQPLNPIQFIINLSNSYSWVHIHIVSKGVQVTSQNRKISATSPVIFHV